MITPGHEEVIGVEELEAEQREDGLHTERAAVHEVPVEQIGVVLAKCSYSYDLKFS